MHNLTACEYFFEIHILPIYILTVKKTLPYVYLQYTSQNTIKVCTSGTKQNDKEPNVHEYIFPTRTHLESIYVRTDYEYTPSKESH